MTPLILIPILLFFALKLLARTRASSKQTSNKNPKPAESAVAPDALETVFAAFDTDRDGFITSGELKQSLRRLGLSTTEDDVSGMMERVDANGDGLIDADEFRALHDSLYGEEELREAFGVFDEDGDGMITVEELGSALVAAGLTRGPVAADECRDMIRKVDLDGDGMVNFAEFKKMMMVSEGCHLASSVFINDGT